jgi:hypothetical protein
VGIPPVADLTITAHNITAPRNPAAHKKEEDQDNTNTPSSSAPLSLPAADEAFITSIASLTPALAADVGPDPCPALADGRPSCRPRHDALRATEPGDGAGAGAGAGEGGREVFNAGSGGVAAPGDVLLWELSEMMLADEFRCMNEE